MIQQLRLKTLTKILLAPIVWLSHSCSPLGNPVDEEKSDNHYYNRNKTDIQFSRMGNWFELSNIAMNADVESFEVLTRLISRDINRWYLGAEPIEKNNLDRNSFYTKNGTFMETTGFDENYVYIFKYGKSVGVPPSITVLDSANPKTFKRTAWDWANDDKNHFYRNQLIMVNHASFRNINRTFSKDDQKVYVHYDDQFIPIKADVKSFEVLDEGYFAMDDLHVFSMTFNEEVENGTNLISIPKTKSEKIQFLSEGFIKIGNRVYYRGTHLSELNSENIEVISNVYIKDKNTVYFKDKKLIDADAPTFVKKGTWDAGDKNGIYINGVREN